MYLLPLSDRRFWSSTTEFPKSGCQRSKKHCQKIGLFRATFIEIQQVCWCPKDQIWKNPQPGSNTHTLFFSPASSIWVITETLQAHAHLSPWVAGILFLIAKSITWNFSLFYIFTFKYDCQSFFQKNPLRTDWSQRILYFFTIQNG